MASSTHVSTPPSPTFETITQPGYLDLLVSRLHDNEAPLSWLAQAREILESEIQTSKSILDVGCATGYAAKIFPELDYVGLDIELQYLEIARQYFAGTNRVAFFQHDLMCAPFGTQKDIVILNAVLEHCPALSPTLDNILASTAKTVLIRTFLGDIQKIHTVPSPKALFADSFRKFSNQYAFDDLFRSMERHGFEGTVIRDRYTDSMPRYVDGSMRTFYFVKATRI